MSVPVYRWSCDEGRSWTRYIFTTTPMRLIGMLPERGERARRVTYVFDKSVCVCVCVCVRVCMYVYVCVHVYMWVITALVDYGLRLDADSLFL